VEVVEPPELAPVGEIEKKWPAPSNSFTGLSAALAFRMATSVRGTVFFGMGYSLTSKGEVAMRD